MKTKNFLQVVFFLILFFSTDTLFARGGGGGGHGGGFGDGGFHGGFSGGYHYGYYGGYGQYVPWGFWDYFIFFCFLGLVVMLFFLFTIVLWKSEFSKKILSKISLNDNFWSMDSMKINARKTFMRIQDAWEARDINRVKDIITPELYTKYDSMLVDMENKGERNIIKNIVISELRIISCEDYLDDSKDRYVAHIKGSLLDYTIHEPSKEIVKNPYRTREDFTDTYHFVRSNNKWLLEHIDNSVNLWDIIRLKNYKE
jgi:hypothetical protein